MFSVNETFERVSRFLSFQISLFPSKGRNFLFFIIIIRVVKFIATNIGLETEIRRGNITLKEKKKIIMTNKNESYKLSFVRVLQIPCTYVTPLKSEVASDRSYSSLCDCLCPIV